MDTIEQQLAGMDDEDRMVAEILGEIAAEKTKASVPSPAKVEVIEPRRVTKLIVSIPPESPEEATVTRVEVMEDGNFRILEAQRAPTPQERAIIMHGKKEVLSAPVAEADAGEKKEGRPWWQWAIGVAVVGGAGLWAAKTYLPQFMPKPNGLEEEGEGEGEEELEEELEEEALEGEE